MNPQGMLGALSESTGGRLIANSNDVRAGLDRAIDDTSGLLRGHLRPAAHRVRRRVPAHRREGEAAGRDRAVARGLLRAAARARDPSTSRGSCRWRTLLKASPAPHDFDTHAAAYRFGPEAGGVRHTLVAEIPLDGLAFEGGRRHAHGALLGPGGRARREGRRARALQPGLARGGPGEEPGGAEARQRGLHALLHPAARPVRPRDRRPRPGREARERAPQRARGDGAAARPRAVERRDRQADRARRRGRARVERPAADRRGPDRAVRRRARVRPGRDRVALPRRLSRRRRRRRRGRRSLTLEFSRDGEVVGPLGRGASDGGRLRPDPLRGERAPRAASAPGRYEVAAVVRQGVSAARERAFFTVAPAAN